MQQGNKPYPPFGAILNEYFKLDVIPQNSLWVYCGQTGYKDAKKMFEQLGQLCIALPYKDHPASYQWPVKGMKTILYDTGGHHTLTYLLEVATELLKAGAKVVWLQSELCPKGQYFTQP